MSYGLARESGGDGSLEDWDIFYSAFDGSHWTVPKQVNPDNDETDAYPRLAVSAPDDIWIVWSEGNPASVGDAGNKSVRWDGGQVIEVARLDNDEYPFDSTPRIALDFTGAPWVVWSTIDEDYGPGAVVYNRYDFNVPVELSGFQGRVGPDFVELSWWAEPRRFVSFQVQEELSSGFKVVDEIFGGNNGSYFWRSSSLPPGDYTYRVQALSLDGSMQTLGPLSLNVGGAPDRMRLHLVRHDPKSSTVLLSVGLPYASVVGLDLIDVLGRQLAHHNLGSLPKGWNEVSVEVRDTSGRTPPNGVYWIRAKEDAVQITLAR